MAAANEHEVRSAANAFKSAETAYKDLGKKPAGTVSPSDLRAAERARDDARTKANQKYDSYRGGFDAADALGVKSRSDFGL